MNETAEQSIKKRSENRQRRARFELRLLPVERDEIAALAEREGVTIGTYMRSRALATPTTKAKRRPTIEVTVLNQLLAELSKEASNLNQLAKKANSGDMPLFAEIKATLDMNRQLVKVIWERLKGNT